MALEGRLRKLEDHLRAEHPMRQPVDPDWCAILDEYGYLKGSMSDKHYRGSPNGLVWMPPENVPEKVLGPGYTRRQFHELAISRGLQSRGRSAPEIAEMLPCYLLAFDELCARDEGGGGHT